MQQNDNHSIELFERSLDELIAACALATIQTRALNQKIKNITETIENIISKTR